MSRAANIIVIVSMAGSANADPESITLGEAIHVAVERNPGLLGGRLDVEIAGDRVTAATGAQDWQLSAGAVWTGTHTRADGQPPASDTGTATASLLRPLPGGGAIGIRSDTTFERDVIALQLEDATTRSKSYAETGDVVVVLRQPLLRGWGGDTAPETQLARTEASRSVAQLEAAAAAASTIRDVVRTYWEVAYARDDLAIRRATLALAEEQLRITRARVSSGRISGSETLAVGQAIGLRKDEVAQAEVTLAAQSLELARLLGREVHDVVRFDPVDRPRPSGDRDVAHELGFALERSPDLAAVRARGRAASIEVEVGENGLLPALDLTASAGPHGAAPDARHLWRQLDRAVGKTYDVELKLTIPLGNRAASGAVAAARRTVRRVKLDERALEVQIEAAVVGSITTMQAARRRIAVLDEAVRLADQGIDAERARWEEGKSTNYDVIKRQAEREDSALRRARAQADLVEAEATLDALTGAILPRYHVALSR